jgi:hypothetical protein
MGGALRVVLGCAGLFAAFGHVAPDGVRLALGCGALGAAALWQRLRAGLPARA